MIPLQTTHGTANAVPILYPQSAPSKDFPRQPERVPGKAAKSRLFP